MATKKMTAAKINDYIFMSFPGGWFAGITAGAVYAGFHWNNLQVELGRTLLVAVTIGQLVTLLLVTLAIRRIDKARQL
jgi:hypothetical protein